MLSLQRSTPLCMHVTGLIISIEICIIYFYSEFQRCVFTRPTHVWIFCNYEGNAVNPRKLKDPNKCKHMYCLNMLPCAVERVNCELSVVIIIVSGFFSCAAISSKRTPVRSKSISSTSYLCCYNEGISQVHTSKAVVLIPVVSMRDLCETTSQQWPTSSCETITLRMNIILRTHENCMWDSVNTCRFCQCKQTARHCSVLGN